MPLIDWIIHEWTTQHVLVNQIMKGLIQIAILTGIIYFAYVRFIRKSYAEQLLKGLFIMPVR